MSNTKGTVTPSEVLRNTAAKGVLARYELDLREPEIKAHPTPVVVDGNGCNPLFLLIPGIQFKAHKRGRSKET